MLTFRRNGYKSKNLTTDIALGVADGLDCSLWCYVYASIIFSGALSGYLSVGVASALVGWMLLSFFVTFTSKEPLHIANLDDQAVVIFGSITLLISNQIGNGAATSSELVTILAVMGITSGIFAVCCYFVGRYGLSKLLDLLPFPVICGFMISIGWLLLQAGFEVTTGFNISFTFFEDLQNSERFWLLVASMVSGIFLAYLLAKLEKFWALPAVLAIMLVGYYLVIFFWDISHVSQTSGGWLFHVSESRGVPEILQTVSIDNINWRFVLDVVPEIITIVFLGVLYTSMTLASMKLGSNEDLEISDEFKVIGAGNLFCALSCSPPGYTDVVSTTMFKRFGASSRWMPISSSLVGFVVLLFGASIINYLPKYLITTGIFLFVFQIFYQWLYVNVKGFSGTDYAIVLVILTTSIFVGFMQGVFMGIILTVLLFVIRYSLIRVVESKTSLRDMRSSVERSGACNNTLLEFGSPFLVYNLRGFLFFGSANRVLDEVLGEALKDKQVRAITMDMSKVTGVDISALNTFSQIKKICDNHEVLLSYSNISTNLKAKMISVSGVSIQGDQALFFESTDFAIEYFEDFILNEQDIDKVALPIEGILRNLIKGESKVALLLNSLEKITLLKGESLFKQGDKNDGFYIIQTGALFAYLEKGDTQIRVKKFRSGSLVGELSGYLDDKFRSAGIDADEDSVVYHLSLEKLIFLEKENEALMSCIHELLATSLAKRINFMNKKLLINN